MSTLPDDAFVVRGGLNTIALLEVGTGITVDDGGNLHGLSAHSAAGRTVAELSVGLPNRQIGVTTVGAIRASGGDVEPDPSRHKPYHCLVGGISVQTASNLLNPPNPNPSWVKRCRGSIMESLTSVQLNCQHLMDKPRVYVDLNAGWPSGESYVVPIKSRATEDDLRQLGHSLTSGLVVDFWTDDGDGAGNPDPLLFQGRLEFDEDVQKWVAVADLDGFHHASEQRAVKQKAEPALASR